MLAMLLSPWHGNVRELDNAARISVERWRKWHKPGSPIHVPFFYTADGDTKLSLDFERRAYENWQEISGRLRKEDMKRLIKTDFSEIPYPMYRGETGANHELGIPTGVEPSFFITLTDILKTLQESYQKRFPEYRKQKKGQEVVPGVTSYSSAHCCEEIRWATQHIGKLWKIGDDVLKFYSSSDGAETAHDRDLTEYTFEELIRKYLLVMKAEHGTQKKAADAAGISEDKFRRHIKPT
jgi:hypothetical protein